MVAKNFQAGDLVVYQMTKQSHHPTLRAKVVSPSENGEDYSYIVEKFWIVTDVTEHGDLVVQTRRGKVRTVSKTDPNLKRANWWHRWTNRNRFPVLNELESENQIQATHS